MTKKELNERLPGEYEKQRAMILLFPYREDVWRCGCEPARRMIIGLANILAESQKTYLGVLPALVDDVRNSYRINPNVEIISVKYNDCWARDTISSVVKGEQPYIAGFKFNSYGSGLYFPWDDDDKLDESIAQIFGYKLYNSEIILEGGNIMPDGNGTVIAVKAGIVNENRNPHLSVSEIEKEILRNTSSKKIIWISRGLYGDETGGHIDNVLSFASANEIILSWTDDIDNPNYKIVREVEETLMNATNANGEAYRIIHLPLPAYHYRTEEECEGIITKAGSEPRLPGDIVLETYTNFALGNEVVIVPQFGNEKKDKAAIDILRSIFTNRKVIPFPGREATLGGGGFHCLTKHIS